MAEVVLMNADDEDGNVKFDLLANQKSKIERLSVVSDIGKFKSWWNTNGTFTVKEITPEEYDKLRAQGKRMVHSGVRASYQKLWNEATDSTYGKLVYAEQIIQVLTSVGGFSSKHAEEVRKAIAKKKTEHLAAYKRLFYCNVMSGFQDDEIEEMWKQIEEAGQYNFNYSHYLVYHRQGMCPDICPICMYGDKKDG